MKHSMITISCMLTFAAAVLSTNAVAKEEFSYFRAIPSPARPESGEPFLFAAADGPVYLSWVEKAGKNAHRMLFSTLEGEKWSVPVTIAEGSDWFVNWADVPSITVGEDGRLAAHWLEKNGAGTYSYGVRVSLSSDGGNTWRRPVIPHNAGEEAEHGFVSMRFVGDDLLVAWLDGRNFVGEDASKEMTVRTARIGPDATLASSLEIDGRACDCCPMDLVLTGGGALLAYRDRSQDEVRDIALANIDPGAQRKPRVTSLYADNWKIPGCPVNGPALDVHGSDVFAAWFTMIDESPAVRCAPVDVASGTVSRPMRVDDGAPVGRVDVVALGDGAALVSWIEDETEGAEIRVRLVRGDGWMADSELIATTSAARSSGYPRIVQSGGRIVAAWTDPSDPPRVRTAAARTSRLTKKL